MFGCDSGLRRCCAWSAHLRHAESAGVPAGSPGCICGGTAACGKSTGDCRRPPHGCASTSHLRTPRVTSPTCAGPTSARSCADATTAPTIRNRATPSRPPNPWCADYPCMCLPRRRPPITSFLTASSLRCAAPLLRSVAPPPSLTCLPRVQPFRSKIPLPPPQPPPQPPQLHHHPQPPASPPCRWSPQHLLQHCP